MSLSTYKEKDNENDFICIRTKLEMLMKYRNELIITHNAYNHLMDNRSVTNDTLHEDSKFGNKLRQIYDHMNDVITRLFSDYNFCSSNIIEGVICLGTKNFFDINSGGYMLKPNLKLLNQYHNAIRPRTLGALKTFETNIKYIAHHTKHDTNVNRYSSREYTHTNVYAINIIKTINHLTKAIDLDYGIDSKELIYE